MANGIINTAKRKKNPYEPLQPMQNPDLASGNAIDPTTGLNKPLGTVESAVKPVNGGPSPVPQMPVPTAQPISSPITDARRELFGSTLAQSGSPQPITDATKRGMFDSAREQTGAPLPQPIPGSPPPGAEGYTAPRDPWKAEEPSLGGTGAPINDAITRFQGAVKDAEAPTSKPESLPTTAPAGEKAYTTNAAPPPAAATAPATPAPASAPPAAPAPALKTGAPATGDSGLYTTNSAQPAPAAATTPPPASQVDNRFVDAAAAQQANDPVAVANEAARAAGSGQQATAPPPGTAQQDPGAAPTGNGQTAWSPTAGIVDQIRGITPETVTGTSYETTEVGPATGYDPEGYTATQAPDAKGYTPEGYESTGVDENLSGAVDRITSKDGIIMQRAKALADQQSNARGLSNSSMAVGASQAAVLDKATEIGKGDVEVGMFNAQVKNDAASFLANAKNVAAQFLAAEQNQNGRFNAEQANQAAAFTANAKNQASAFLAEATNTNNRMAVEQANLAARFAAEMDQAAKEFNATAFNQASQRYVDALNAAVAAQNDAENLSRRDTAQIGADLTRTKMQIEGQLRAAQAAAAGQAAAAAANRDIAMKQMDMQMTQFGMTMSQREREFASGLSSQQFGQFMSGLNQGLLTEMEPDARQNWLHNYMSVWNANGGLNFNIDVSAFPPAGNTTTNTNPPPPGGNPVGR